MKGFLSLVARRLVLFCCVIASGHTIADSVTVTPMPVEAFSALPESEKPRLSPSGERIAFVQNVNEPEEISVLATYDLKAQKMFYLLSSDNEKIKINWFKWANDERLVISARYESKRGVTRFYETRMFSMRYDDQGKDPVNLINWRRLSRRSTNNYHVPQFQDSVIDWLPDDPNHVLVAIDVEVPNLPSVYKVNLEDASAERVELGKRQIREWITDRQGNVRVGVSLDHEDGEQKVLLRDGEEWRTLFAFNAMQERGAVVLGFALDPNILYYKAYKGDYLALYALNIKTNEITELLSEEFHDVSGGLIYSKATNDAIGVYHAHAPNGRHYWDDRHVGLQKQIDVALPEFDNHLISFSRDENIYLLYSDSDTQPGLYLLGNRKKGELNVLFQQYSQIDPTRLNEHSKVAMKMRDGVLVDGYLTLPNTGKAPYPTIIHPHGGPGARDYDGFDYWTAFFINKGYAVIRPNFRGSQGYGASFAEAQMKAWGLQMQDDITDVTQWMIAQGYADPDRLCIVGASYGGYAALMATVKTPDLYKCAISFAGVANLKDVVVRSRNFTNNEFVKNQFGDDYSDLASRSPVTYVEKIKTPILLLHGNEDRVVDVNQSRDMAEELEDENKPVKYVELEAGDHNLSIQRNRHAVFKEMDSFLSKHLD
ncbi:S9 family peptidase [Alteromonas sp. ASW11-19]|uniref:S9 family peptidase n=1 Tax=Alteromonas salexigens TaxID=2982530 RepID=A0ABT2VK65_9ALTE|nr:S9 family peptidase [Alteromonas salexigens]MCU7553564.1 S9 family peptidase [Alteromonas salexigens]